MPEGGQLPAALVVFDHEARTDQKRFGHLADRSGRKPNHRSNHVETFRTIGQDRHVLLFDNAKPKGIDVLKQAGTSQMTMRDGLFTQAAADTVAGLKQTESKSRRPSCPLSDHREDRFLNVPSQALGAVDKHGRQFLDRIKLKAKYQPHSISERLKQAVLIGRTEQQGEVVERQALDVLPA